jgi:hypothetical protein
MHSFEKLIDQWGRPNSEVIKDEDMNCWLDGVAYASLRTEETGIQHRAVYNHLTRAVHVLPEGQRLTELENQTEGQQQ